MKTIDQHHEHEAASRLLSAEAVRDRCGQVRAARDHLTYFRVHEDRLETVADYVLETTRQNYPDLNIPFHARWRHFVFDQVDRWQELAATVEGDAEELARSRIDLVVTSVLLDAGAGTEWRYRDARAGKDVRRSEGLALASLDGFAAGLFSSSDRTNLVADADALKAVTATALGAAFQVTPDNPLQGLEGRAALLRALGATVAQHPELFPGEVPRVGNLFNWIKQEMGDEVDATALLNLVLRAFGDIWPGRLTLGGVNLGDTWQHASVKATDGTDGLIPFHKLSQWLTYSLIEPLQDAGLRVTNIDGLTGLAEYRNGGLFVDLGALEVRDRTLLDVAHHPGDTFIVEWRALSVALLDEVAMMIRRKLGRRPEDLPLASILEGGTWSAGRRIAATLREDASPPIQIKSDGSVF